MIIVRLNGGMGNQMFQYAYGKYLQKYYHDDTLVLDTTWVDKWIDNCEKIYGNYTLDKLNIPSPLEGVIVTNLSHDKKYKLSVPNKLAYFFLRGFYKFKYLRWISNLLRPIANIFGGVLFQLEKQRVRKALPSICKTKFVLGYFGAERFYRDFRDELKEEFKVTTETTPENELILNRIKKEESVCLHIRLGDYLKFSDIYDTLCDDYYVKAIDYIEIAVDNPVFFVFSNDIKLAKERLKEVRKGEGINDKFIYVDNNNVGYDDFKLMSACKHFIIPNSTFSWWAQYVGQYENKIVVAPKKWLNGLPYEDGMMSEWITF